MLTVYSGDLELHLDGFACLGLDLEVILLRESEDPRHEVCRERLDRGVETHHRVVVELAGVSDLALCPRELFLQHHEVLIGLEIRISLGHRKQRLQRRAERVFRLALLLHALRAHGHVARLGHLLKSLRLMRRVALHGLHEVRNEVIPALELDVYLRPCILNPITQDDQTVVQDDTCNREKGNKCPTSAEQEAKDPRNTHHEYLPVDTYVADCATLAHDVSREYTPMIPIRDENPTRRFPVATAILLAVNTAVFVYMLTLSNDALVSFITRWALSPARLVAEPFSPTVLVTVFTAMFLHGGWLHLGGNMLYLWIFGNNVEDALGPVKFAGFYLASGIIATLTHVLVQGPSEVMLLGASGAIAGVLAGYLLLFPRAHVLVLIPIFFIIELARVPAAFVIGFWFLMQLIQGVGSIVPGAAGAGVAWWAHIGGFVAGLILILPRRLAANGRRNGRSSFRTWR